MLELIPINCDRIIQSKSYTVFVLGNDSKRFGIYAAPHVGQGLGEELFEKHEMRPLTHHFLTSILNGLNVKLLKVVIWDVQESIFFAKLFLEQEVDGTRNILEIDCRPSDCLTLALENNLPIYCDRNIMEQVTALED